MVERHIKVYRRLTGRDRGGNSTGASGFVGGKSHIPISNTVVGCPVAPISDRHKSLPKDEETEDVDWEYEYVEIETKAAP